MKHLYIWHDCFFCKGKRNKPHLIHGGYDYNQCIMCKGELGSFKKQPLVIDGGDYTINAVELKRNGIDVNMSWSA